MKLVDRSVDDFCTVLASCEPAPGGGSSAALEGALGAALVGMSASLTIGRKKYAKHEELMIAAEGRAGELRLNFLDIIDRDAEAFNLVSAVFTMPKETNAEIAERSAAMQAALKACTMTPLEVMECALATLELMSEMLGKYNYNTASDFGVAALSLKAAVQGAWLNVLINLGGIEDMQFSSERRMQGEAAMDRALALADMIYADALRGIGK